jgi:hypothetical protein
MGNGIVEVGQRVKGNGLTGAEVENRSLELGWIGMSNPRQEFYGKVIPLPLYVYRCGVDAIYGSPADQPNDAHGNTFS